MKKVTPELVNNLANKFNQALKATYYSSVDSFTTHESTYKN